MTTSISASSSNVTHQQLGSLLAYSGGSTARQKEGELEGLWQEAKGIVAKTYSLQIQVRRFHWILSPPAFSRLRLPAKTGHGYRHGHQT
jgi:hypothetical protein